jgi:hypothetical protein
MSTTWTHPQDYVRRRRWMVKTADDPAAVADIAPMALRLVGADPDTHRSPARAAEGSHR